METRTTLNSGEEHYVAPKKRKKKSVKKTSVVRSMEEFQKEYFSKLVGIHCPYCGSDIKPKEREVDLRCAYSRNG